MQIPQPPPDWAATVAMALSGANLLVAVRASYFIGKVIQTVSEHGRRLKKLDGLDSDVSN